MNLARDKKSLHVLWGNNGNKDEILMKTSVHSLGVLLDSGLLLDGQVEGIARSTYEDLWLMHQLCLSLPGLEKYCLSYPCSGYLQVQLLQGTLSTW